MNADFTRKVAILCEERDKLQRRRIGLLLVPNPQNGLDLPPGLVVPTPAPSSGSLARLYPNAEHVFDGRRGDHVPFVLAMYIVRQTCPASLETVAEVIEDRLPGYASLIFPSDTTYDFIETWVREHARHALPSYEEYQHEDDF